MADQFPHDLWIRPKGVDPATWDRRVREAAQWIKARGGRATVTGSGTGETGLRIYAQTGTGEPFRIPPVLKSFLAGARGSAAQWSRFLTTSSEGGAKRLAHTTGPSNLRELVEEGKARRQPRVRHDDYQRSLDDLSRARKLLRELEGKRQDSSRHEMSERDYLAQKQELERTIRQAEDTQRRYSEQKTKPIAKSTARRRSEQNKARLAEWYGTEKPPPEEPAKEYPKTLTQMKVLKPGAKARNTRMVREMQKGPGESLGGYKANLERMVSAGEHPLPMAARYAKDFESKGGVHPSVASGHRSRWNEAIERGSIGAEAVHRRMNIKEARASAGSAARVDKYLYRRGLATSKRRLGSQRRGSHLNAPVMDPAAEELARLRKHPPVFSNKEEYKHQTAASGKTAREYWKDRYRDTRTLPRGGDDFRRARAHEEGAKLKEGSKFIEDRESAKEMRRIARNYTEAGKVKAAEAQKEGFRARPMPRGVKTKGRKFSGGKPGRLGGLLMAADIGSRQIGEAIGYGRTAGERVKRALTPERLKAPLTPEELDQAEFERKATKGLMSIPKRLAESARLAMEGSEEDRKKARERWRRIKRARERHLVGVR